MICHPPAAGEVRVKHTAIGINFIEIYFRTGLYSMPLPSGLGSEAAGVVEELGAGVTRAESGRPGRYLQQPRRLCRGQQRGGDKLVKLPAGISDEMAAASMLKGMTAQYLLKRTYAVQKDDTILFHAAAGGVGQIACQWARHLGAHVIGTTTSPGKIEQARANGCEHVLLLSDPGWVKKVRELTGGKGVPVVYDSVGKDTFEQSLDCLRIRGLMVSFGNSSGAVPPIAPGMLTPKGSLYLTRPTMLHYTRDAQELQATADDLFGVIQSGAVKVAINQRFALKDAAKAHDALANRQTIGATVLIP